MSALLSKKNFLQNHKIIFNFIFVFLVATLAFLSLAVPKASAEVSCGDFPDDPSCCPTGETVVPDSYCSTNNVFKPATDCNTSTWVFTYQVCVRVWDADRALCNYSYQPKTLSCPATDRCYDPSIGNVPGSTGGGAASGSNSSGVILPGICDATKFDGSDPNTACVAGSHYKQCCTAPSPGLNPPTSCSAGVCPDANAFITSPNDTSCDTPSQTCAQKGGVCQGAGQTCTGAISGAYDCPNSCYTTCSNPCTASLTASPTSVPSTGGLSTLSWNTTNADGSCTATGDWFGSKATANNQTQTQTLNVIPPKTYGLTCQNSAGTTCGPATTTVGSYNLSCSLTASPSSGNRPLNNVDLTADVGGTATGLINYNFECGNGTTRTVNNTNIDPYTAVDLCNYTSEGTYTAKATVTRQGATSSCTAAVSVGVTPPPTPTPTPPPPGYSCTTSATDTGDTSGRGTVTQSGDATGYDRTNWWLDNNFIGTNTGLTADFSGLAPRTTYTVKAERYSNGGTRPSKDCGTASFTTGGGGGGGGETLCWSWYACKNRDGSEGATRFESGNTTDCNPAANGTLGGRCPHGVHHFGSCGTCGGGGGGGGGGDSCTTGWTGVGGYTISCGTPVPGGFMSKQMKLSITGGGGSDENISWDCCGSSGGSYNTSDGATYTFTGGGAARVGDTKQTPYWGSDKLVTGGIFRVGCNDGESIDISVERCKPSCEQSAPSAPTLSSPGNGASVVSSPVTLTFSHNGNFGTSCAGGSNRLKVYAGVGSPSSVVCDLPPGSTSCQTSVSDGQNYQWKVQATNGALSSDSATWAFSVLFNSGGWFQVKDSDVTSPGDLISRIPLQCSGGNCTPEFGLSGGGGYPGVPAYGGSNYDFGGGTASITEWLANTRYSGRRYDYAWFARLAPEGTFTTSEGIIEEDEISGGDLVSGYQSGDYVWRYKDGNLTIRSTTNLGNRKVVLFVKGNLTIDDSLTINPGQGFFLAVVSGNINISPNVSHPNQPALGGLFMADGTISTGTRNPTPDNRLYVRGALVGWSGVNLERDLDPTKTSGDNNLEAAEFIEYAPDLILTFPRELLREGLVWKEVAP